MLFRSLTYGSLKITWVRNRFSNLPEGANAITTQQYARAYMFQVLALLFGNKSQSRLHCCFLQLLADFGVSGLVSHLLSFIKSCVLLQLKKAWRLQVLFSYYNYRRGSIFHIRPPIPINPTNLNSDNPYGCRYNIYFLFLYNIVYRSIYP